VSAVTAPGILPGLAPPAAEGPPASTGSPVTGKTFADTVAAHRAATDAAPGAAPEAASEPDAPPGEPTAEITTTADSAGLLVLVQDLIARDTGAAGTDATNETEAPLPDRPAGAGDASNETDVDAMEALMAQMLLVRTAPLDDVTTAPVALAAAPADAGRSEAASTLAALQQSVADGAALAAAEAPQGAVATVPGIAVDGSAAMQIVQAVVAQDAAPAPSPAAVSETDAARPATPGATAVASAAGDQATAPASTARAVEVQPPAEASVGDQESSGHAAAVRGNANIDPVSVDPADTGVGAQSMAEPVQQAQTPDGAREPSVNEGGARRARAVQADGTAANTLAATAPRAAGDTLAASATTRAEVATPGAVTSQIASTVQTAVLRGQHEVRLVLNPPELGRVEIQITESTGGIRVHMLADQPGARDLIERQLPLLQQALAAREVRVERLEVGRPGEPASAQQWSSSQGSNDGQRQRGQQDGSAPDWSPLASMGLGITERTRADRPRAVSTGGLDVMA